MFSQTLLFIQVRKSGPKVFWSIHLSSCQSHQIPKDLLWLPWDLCDWLPIVGLYWGEHGCVRLTLFHFRGNVLLDKSMKCSVTFRTTKTPVTGESAQQLKAASSNLTGQNTERSLTFQSVQKHSFLIVSHAESLSGTAQLKCDRGVRDRTIWGILGAHPPSFEAFPPDVNTSDLVVCNNVFLIYQSIFSK